MEKFFPATNSQKIIWFLIDAPRKTFLESEIKKETSLSKAGINFALKDLKRGKLVLRKKIGKTYLYSADISNSFVKQLKILKNVLSLDVLVKKIIPLVGKIILFGSASRGENDETSDFDLFILTNNREAVAAALAKSRLKLQPIIKNQVEYVQLEKNDRVFINEVERGVILYDEKFSIR